MMFSKYMFGMLAGLAACLFSVSAAAQTYPFDSVRPIVTLQTEQAPDSQFLAVSMNYLGRKGQAVYASLDYLKNRGWFSGGTLPGEGGIYGGSGFVPDSTFIHLDTNAGPIFFGRGFQSGVYMMRTGEADPSQLPTPPTQNMSWGFYTADYNFSSGRWGRSTSGVRFVADSTWTEDRNSFASLWMRTKINSVGVRFIDSKNNTSFITSGGANYVNFLDSTSYFFAPGTIEGVDKKYSFLYQIQSEPSGGYKGMLSTGQQFNQAYGELSFSGIPETFPAYNQDGYIIETDGPISYELTRKSLTIPAAGNSLQINNVGLFRAGSDGNGTAPYEFSGSTFQAIPTVVEKDDPNGRAALELQYGAFEAVDTSGSYVLERLAKPYLVQVDTINFGNTADGSTNSVTVSVPGAEIGRAVTVNRNGPFVRPSHVYAYVSAADQVEVTFLNLSGSAIDPAAHPFTIAVSRYGP